MADADEDARCWCCPPVARVGEWGSRRAANHRAEDAPLQPTRCGTAEMSEERGDMMRLATRETRLRESGLVWLIEVYYKSISLSHGEVYNKSK